MTAAEDVVHRQVVEGAEHELPSARRMAELVRLADPLLPGRAVDRAVARVQARMTGLGPLEPLLADPDVTDVLVNGPGLVWVERGGVLAPTEIHLDRATIDLLVERIVAPLGRRVDPTNPVVDGRLPDGSRVHVVVPPLAIDGPCLTIRRFRARPVSLDEMASPAVAVLLRWAVRSRANLVIVGGTGSGKTTLLNAMAVSIPRNERVVTVEDAAELRLPSDHVIRLETRPGSVEGTPAVTCRDLVRNALRMRPDRLLVGEVRGGEALDMVQAMNTGHDGSLCTLHANGCDDAMRRLETLVLMAGVGLPLEAVRDHLGAAIDLVVHVERGPGGGRRVVAVAEVLEPGSEIADRTARTRRLANAHEIVSAPQRPVRSTAAGPSPELGADLVSGP